MKRHSAVLRTALIGAVGVAVLGATGCVTSAPAADASPTGMASACGEACLKAVMDGYLEALVAHDPSRLRTTPDVRFTENAVDLELGEGLWVTFESLGGYRHDFYDPQTGGVATYVSAVENGYPDLLSVRLKVENGAISEIETVVARKRANAELLATVAPSWAETFDRKEPVATRLTRQELIDGALGYMRAVAFVDGSLGPFGESCVRLENGGITALGPNDEPPLPMPAPRGGAADRPNTMGIGCGDEQLSIGSYSFITGFEDARFPIVDVERQVVWATFDFMRRGNVKTYTYQGRTYEINSFVNADWPNEMLNTEAWKFVDGKIALVEAVFTGPQPYKHGTGWPGGTPPVTRD